MAAPIRRLVTRSESLQQDQAAELRQMVLSLEPSAPAAVSTLLAVIDRHTAATKGWTFVMLSPSQNRAVVRWLRQNSRRSGVAIELWAVLFEKMRMDTGEIIASRADLAAEVGCHPNHISAVLSEMVECGAISRRQDGREVHWYMNPMVGTCLTGKAREDAQAAAPRLRLVPQA